MHLGALELLLPIEGLVVAQAHVAEELEPSTW